MLERKIDGWKTNYFPVGRRPPFQWLLCYDCFVECMIFLSFFKGRSLLNSRVVTKTHWVKSHGSKQKLPLSIGAINTSLKLVQFPAMLDLSGNCTFYHKEPTHQILIALHFGYPRNNPKLSRFPRKSWGCFVLPHPSPVRCDH